MRKQKKESMWNVYTIEDERPKFGGGGHRQDRASAKATADGQLQPTELTSAVLILTFSAESSHNVKGLVELALPSNDS